MQTIEKTVDQNAALEDLSCRVEVQNGRPIGLLRFRNLGGGRLRAVKLRGYGTNAFGECVCVNGSSAFTVLLQDLNIPPCTMSPELSFPLPAAEMRAVTLQEDMTKFADGSVHTRAESAPRPYEIEGLSGAGREGMVLQYLRTITDDAVCLYKEKEDGWICLCGRWNEPGAESCARCGTSRKRLLTLSDLDEVAQFLEKRRRQEEEALRREQEKTLRREEERRLAEEERLKRRKRLGMAISAVFCVLVMIGVGAVFINYALLSSRVTYGSAEQMARALEGVWVPEDGGAEDALILGYGVVEYPEMDETQIGYIPSRGLLYLNGEKVVVRREEAKAYLEKGGRLYQKAHEEPADTPPAYDASEASKEPTSESSASSPPRDTATLGEKNALADALRYLDVLGGFSREGLADQLDFEGYSSGEIDYALAHCGADWKEQAVIAASQYLNAMPFSRQGLIDQLEFEGFTHEQAVYGVTQNGY